MNPTASNLNPERDHRIDAIRGIALLILFSDHVEGNVVAQFTPVAFGLSDMSDVFVFLSGYSCGLSYWRRLNTQGFASCIRRAWGRAVQVYLVDILISGLSLLMIVGIGNGLLAHFKGISWSMEFVRDYPLETLFELQLLRVQLLEYFMLAFYLFFLTVLPFVLWGFGKFPCVTALVSIVLYLAVQIFPASLMLPIPWRYAIVFNLFAWQFLFFSAVGLAIIEPKTYSQSPYRREIAVGACFIFVAVILFQLREGGLPNFWIDKQNLGALRLIHFYSALIIVWCLASRAGPFVEHKIAQPLIVCGRYPLVGYCAGGFLAILADALMPFTCDKLHFQLMLNGLGWIGVISATSMRRLFDKRRSP